MNHYLDLVEKSFDSTVQTWRSKPKFDRDVKVGTFQIVGEYGTDDDVMNWVSNGTRVRYATMTPDFQAKTKVGRIRSNAGRGGVAFVNRRVPRPGIRARKFDELIVKSRMRNLQLAFKRAIKKGVKRSGHSA